jgi:ferredoxin-like protein FixX
VQLHIEGKAICSQLKQWICEAATVPAYLKYVATRNKWLSAVVDTIDMQAYTQAIGQFRTQHTQITKLCNALLPTAQWAHRYDSMTMEHCLHCGEPEDCNHIIQCSFGSHQTWRNSLLTKLCKAHNYDSLDHYLLDILINCLDCWFKGTALIPCDIDAISSVGIYLLNGA